MENVNHILKTIDLIRDSFSNSVNVYTKGSCVKFAMILKHLYPEGDIYYDMDHAIFKYGCNYYDINGFAQKNDGHIPLIEYGLLVAYDIMNLKYNFE